jgi:hypothetical protein
MQVSKVNGSGAVTRLAGVFLSEADATEAIRCVTVHAGLSEFQVRLLRPQELTSVRARFRALLQLDVMLDAFPRSTTLWGLAFGALGAWMWHVLRMLSWMADSPRLSLLALVALGVVCGMFGATAFAPTEAWRGEAQAGLKAGRWVAVFHPATAAQAVAIQAELQRAPATLNVPDFPGVVDQPVSG